MAMNQFTASTFAKAVVKMHALVTPSTSQPEACEMEPLCLSPSKNESLSIGALNHSFDENEEPVTKV